MKLMEGFEITELDGDYVVVPTQDVVDFSGIVRLNESAKDIWEGIAEGLSKDGIADRLVELYDGVSRELALESVQSVIDTLVQEGLLTL